MPQPQGISLRNQIQFKSWDPAIYWWGVPQTASKNSFSDSVPEVGKESDF
jgi:hypothetical protein